MSEPAAGVSHGIKMWCSEWCLALNREVPLSDLIDPGNPADASLQGRRAIGGDMSLIDRRVIAFRSDCLVRAMQTRGGPLGLARERAVKSATPDPVGQRVAFGHDAEEGETSFTVGGPELASLLIAYCIGVGIPIPTRASKRMTVVSDGVLLDFVVGYRQPPRPR